MMEFFNAQLDQSHDQDCPDWSFVARRLTITIRKKSEKEEKDGKLIEKGDCVCACACVCVRERERERERRNSYDSRAFSSQVFTLCKLSASYPLASYVGVFVCMRVFVCVVCVCVCV